MLKFIYIVCFVTIMVVASSCAEYHFKSQIPEKYETILHDADVKPGITTREEMQEKLGTPFIDDKRLSVSVYKVLSGHDVALAGPIIPVGADVEDVIIYALVVYGNEGVVKDIDWGIYHEDEGRTTLEASGFRFDSYNVSLRIPHTEFLLAPLPYSQNSIHTQSPSGACTLFVTPQDSICTVFKGNTSIGKYCSPAEGYGEMIYIDEVPLVDKPVAFAGFFRILIPVGEHELAASILTPGFFSRKPVYFRKRFSCSSGESLYATPYIQGRDSGDFWDWNKSTYEGELLIRDTPWIFYDLQQFLFYGGKDFYQ